MLIYVRPSNEAASNSPYFSLEEWPRLPFTARIQERPLLYRGGSASEGHQAALPHPSEARVARGTEDHQAPSPPLFREQRTNVGVTPILPLAPCSPVGGRLEFELLSLVARLVMRVVFLLLLLLFFSVTPALRRTRLL